MAEQALVHRDSRAGVVHLAAVGLAAPTPAVTGALEATGLSAHFDIYPTVGAAISEAALATAH